MTTQRLGVIMNGVTGRMGLNQHLIRSIIAIRDQGGVKLSNGDRVMPDPILVGRDAAEGRGARQALRVERWTTDLDAALVRQERRGVLRCRDHAGAAGVADAGRSTPASTSIARSRPRPTSKRRSRS